MVEESSVEPRISYIETGVPGLDQVLGGGLVEAGLYLVQGNAGSGKTILSGQIAFHLAHHNRKVVFATLIAESHGKLLQHLSTLRFFDRALLGDRVILFSCYEALLEGGFGGLIRLLAEMLHGHGPAMLVIDGFSTIHDFTEERGSLPRFIHELNALVTATRCTTLLLTHKGPSTDLSTEEMLADGVLELSVFPAGMRRGRELEVQKLRASAPLTGTHAFRIDAAGVSVFPRLEAAVEREGVEAPAAGERVPFGITTLDRILGGGIPAASVTSLFGSSGSGKTLLGLQFLHAGASRGENCLYLGFFEPPDRLLAKSASIGLDFGQVVGTGLMQLSWHPAFELHVDELAHRLLALVRSRGVRRLFIDGVEGFSEGAVHKERTSTFLTALSVKLRDLRVTTLFSEELPLFSEVIETGNSVLSAVVENILLLRHVEIASELRRLVSVIKMRESDFDAGIREFSISSTGISVLSKFEALEGTLSGYARRVSGGT